MTRAKGRPAPASPAALGARNPLGWRIRVSLPGSDTEHPCGYRGGSPGPNTRPGEPHMSRGMGASRRLPSARKGRAPPQPGRRWSDKLQRPANPENQIFWGKKKERKLIWNFVVSAANSAGQERWLQPRNRNYRTFHNTQFPRDFISFMGFPFSLSVASASKAPSDSMTVCLVCYHKNKTTHQKKKKKKKPPKLLV